jgi:hypothetical protein
VLVLQKYQIRCHKRLIEAIKSERQKDSDHL